VWVRSPPPAPLIPNNCTIRPWQVPWPEPDRAQLSLISHSCGFPLLEPPQLAPSFRRRSLLLHDGVRIESRSPLA
jgi:hypothetical protein